MTLRLDMLISDWLIYGLFFIAVMVFWYAAKQPHWREPWQRVLKSRIAMVSIVMLGFYIVTGLLDSIHFQVTIVQQGQQQVRLKSLFDLILWPLHHIDERTYSAPFSLHLYSVTNPERLKFAATHLISEQARTWDITWRALLGAVEGFLSGFILLCLSLGVACRVKKLKFTLSLKKLMKDQTENPWRTAAVTFFMIWMLVWITANLAGHYHLFGTDKIGRDVLYEAVKSIRTGLLIGTLTTIFMLPIAVVFGLMAGYFGGWLDDVIQYLYTTLSSIPGVLLISASVLVMQVYIANHPALFPTIAQRADARLLALCFILGITSWASLCRLLRAETLKLRELEYIQAARVLGVSRFKILMRHLFPNVLHIVLITIVLDFSGLVLAEAVLSYVGVGVDPTTMSWGNMINSSRLELAREPIVWWPLLASLIFMFGLVLSANLFSDVLRDALDPRLKE